MKRQGRFLRLRTAAFSVVGVLVMLAVGDRARSAVSRGIDPLDALDRTAKPNVILVLDGSASMRNTPYFNAGSAPGTGDWSKSKMALAKSSISTLIANNQSKASFMLASFQESTTPAFNTGSSRLYYVATATSGSLPAWATTSFTFSAWQNVQADTTAQGTAVAAPNTVYWTEASGSSSINPVITIGSGVNDKIYFREPRAFNKLDEYRTCTVTLPAALYGSYGNGTTDTNFTALLTAINLLLTSANGTARSCILTGSPGSTPDNDYSFSYNTGTFQFTLTAHAKTTTNTPKEYQILDGSTLLDAFGLSTSLPATASTYTTSFAGGPPPTSSDYSTTTTNVGTDVHSTGSVSPVACSASITAGFFQTAAAFATALQNAMNTGTPCAGATAPTLTYTVTPNSPSAGRFTIARSAGTNLFLMNWGTGTPNNIGGVLGESGFSDTSLGTSFNTSASSLAFFASPGSRSQDVIGGTTFVNSVISAGRFFNGQTLSVDTVSSPGTVCGISTGTATTPPTLIVQSVSGCGGSVVDTTSVALEGANWNDDVAGGAGVPGTGSCSGYQSIVDLVACDTATAQTTTFSTALKPGLTLGASTPYNPAGYTEKTDGGFGVLASPTHAGVIAFETNTPLASAINGVAGAFTTLYNTGSFGLTAISSHSQPRERTVVILITDGNDNCAVDLGSTDDTNALATAYQAQLLYAPISGSLNTDGTFASGTEPASSVTTYVVGFGNGINTLIDTNHLNWIAWGGSGLGPQMSASGTPGRWSSTPTEGQREACATCTDAYIAIDKAALDTDLQSIIDQATQAGEGIFTASQTIQASVFELADTVTGSGSMDPKTRYDSLIPLGFEAPFAMPGFRGTVRAIANSSGSPSVFWDAGAKLLTAVQTSMNLTTAANSPTGVTGQLSFKQLGGQATSVTSSSTFGINRRIYSTAGNGTFPVIDSDFATLFAAGSPCRVQLWPPNVSPATPNTSCLGTGKVAPPDDTTEGVLDVPLGLPSDAAITAGAAAQVIALQTTYEVCLAAPPAINNPSANCSDPSPTVVAKRARREAREILLAYIAGATVVLDSAGHPARATTTDLSGKWVTGDIVFKARPWLMAESTLTSPAVVAPPIEIEPGTTGYVAEYKLYRDGLPANRNSSVAAIDGLAQGFGLRNPDKGDLSAPTSGDDSRTTLKPAMTAVYIGANDMLHAFRAGPNCKTVPYTTCTEKGGEEMWGFLPFDRLGVVKNLLTPQTRANKTYGVASGVRFADAFVQAPGGTYSATVGTAAISGSGVWRQVLTFGRGLGGKYYTVLDISGRGAFTAKALDTPPPIVYWNRGNPDTIDGTGGGTAVRSADTSKYAAMGETWSVPAIAFVDKANNQGTSSVLYTGSGYSDVSSEGTTFFVLDTVTGNVVYFADVEAAATAQSVNRTGLSYANALVAGPAAYSGRQLTPGQAGHPSDITTRVYIGDLHGRLWKFLSTSATPILMADLGVDQPVGVSPALLALGNGTAQRAYVYVTSGRDNRVPDSTVFKIFGFRDENSSDTDTAAGTRTVTADDASVFVYPPQSSSLFDQTMPVDGSGNSVHFRGTVQPATAFEDTGNGRVFFAGTRFNGFLSAFAPAVYPCLATFDSVVFALGAETGGAAYDLNSSGTDAYTIFSNSRKLALQVIREPAASSSSTSQPAKLFLDEGLMSSGTSPNPPSPAGFSPQIVPQPPSVSIYTRGPSGTGTVFPQYSSPRLCQ